MGKRKMKQGHSSSYKRFAPVLWGGVAGLGGVLAALLLISIAMTVGEIPQSLVEPLGVAALAVGGFLSGYVSARMVPSGGFYVALACGFLLFVLILPAGIAVTGKNIGLMALIKLFTLLLAAALGGLSGTSKRYAR